MNPARPTRRQFLTGILATAAVGLLPMPAAHAADAPHLTEDDATAKSLGYVASAAKAAKDPAYKKGSSCAGCALYQAAQEKGGYAPCAAFPGKAVSKSGWCRAFAAKPA